MDEFELLWWEVSYDGSTDDAEDDPPTAGNNLRKVNCLPFRDTSDATDGGGALWSLVITPGA